MGIPAGIMRLRKEKIEEVLSQFPDAPTRTLARKLFHDSPELFLSVETARSALRTLLGANGSLNLKLLKDKRYVRKSV